MEVKLMCNVDEIRPDLLRKIICIVYFPLAVPLIFLCSAFIGLLFTINNSIADTWGGFIIPCWKGTRVPDSKWFAEGFKL